MYHAMTSINRCETCMAALTRLVVLDIQHLSFNEVLMGLAVVLNLRQKKVIHSDSGGFRLCHGFVFQIAAPARCLVSSLQDTQVIFGPSLQRSTAISSSRKTMKRDGMVRLKRCWFHKPFELSQAFVHKYCKARQKYDFFCAYCIHIFDFDHKYLKKNIIIPYQ